MLSLMSSPRQYNPWPTPALAPGSRWQWHHHAWTQQAVAVAIIVAGFTSVIAVYPVLRTELNYAENHPPFRHFRHLRLRAYPLLHHIKSKRHTNILQIGRWGARQGDVLQNANERHRIRLSLRNSSFAHNDPIHFSH